MTERKTAVVSAGSRGIGRAVVLKLAAAGMNVITCSRSQEKLDALFEEHSALPGTGSLDTIATDLSKKAGVDTFAKFVVQKGLDVDLVVNNAGGFIPGKISDEPDGALESMIELNLYSAYHLTRHLLPNMISRKQGHIINICSIASIIPYLYGGSYCIAKFALLGFSKVLREELKAHGIRVTSVLPGPALSDSWGEVDLPPERFMPVEDVAACVFDAFSLSPRTVVEEILIRPQLGDI